MRLVLVVQRVKPVLVAQRVRQVLVVALVKVQGVETVIAMTVKMRRRVHKTVPEVPLVAAMALAMTVRMR